MARRAYFAPEVVQTSAMDCGPAALKALLEGFGRPVSYGRLREACQTDVDGTSIDTIEEIAAQLGLRAEQVMIPVDHLLVQPEENLPAIVVTSRPNGLTHFLVAWRRHAGRRVQVMDPASGRRWLSENDFLDEIYLHRHPVPAAGWAEWAASEDFLEPLRRRLRALGVSQPAERVGKIAAAAAAHGGWRQLAALDAATRFTTALAEAGQRPADPAGLIRTLAAEAAASLAAGEPFADNPIPAGYWSVEPAPGDPDTLLLRGAILIRIAGLAPAGGEDGIPAPLPPDLAAALAEPPLRPEIELLRLLRQDGLLRPLVVAALALLAGGGVALQALFWRSLIDAGQWLAAPAPRAWFAAGFLALLLLTFFVDRLFFDGALAWGRQLETRLRLAILEKIPRLQDRYLASRPISDMAERSHHLHRLRQIPLNGSLLLRTLFTLLFTTIGLHLLLPDPTGRFLAWLNAGLGVAIPLAFQPALNERDLRARTHLGGLAAYYLDGLRALVPLRTHGGEENLAREHEGVLVEWGGAAAQTLRAVVQLTLWQNLAALGLAAALILVAVRAGGPGEELLLIAYWALNVPLLGEEISQLAARYPQQRNHLLRLLELLGSSEDPPPAAEAAPAPRPATPAAIRFQGVGVRAAGHVILQEVDEEIAAGEHLAIIGPSGAGKSTLVGVLLGWHRPARGEIRVDGRPLDPAALAALRRETVWVDPAVQLWNRSFLENVTYGLGEDAPAEGLARVVEQAELVPLLEQLPAGWQASLGEDGGLVSGGEGQRVRLGRGILRAAPRLVILDEPFRGLDRPQRQRLLKRARALWREATLICITHDVAHTADFDRVWVVEQGRVVESGPPADLLTTRGSRYRQLLAAEKKVRDTLWRSAAWRRWRVEKGMIEEKDR